MVNFALVDFLKFVVKHAEYESSSSLACFLKDRLELFPPPHPLTIREVQEILEVTGRLTADWHRLWPRKEEGELMKIKFEVVRLQRDLLYYLLFPINNLPNEVLLYIFHTAIWSAQTTQDGIQTRQSLSAVSSRWQRLINQDPTLWSVIEVHGHKDVRRAIRWFQRTGDTALDLHIEENNIHSTEERHSFDQQDIAALLGIVSAKVSQIRQLYVDTEYLPAMLAILETLREAGQLGLPLNIQRIELHRSGFPFIWIDPEFRSHQPIPLFGGACALALRHIVLDGVHIDWNTSWISALKTLDLRRISLTMCPSLPIFRQILHSSPNLSRLVLDSAGPVPNDESGIQLTPIKLLHLEDLVLGNFSATYAQFILKQFDAPHVHRLTLQNLTGGDYTNLVVQMTGCHPEVQDLNIVNVDIPWPTASIIPIVAWLRSMPRLTDLCIGQVDRGFLELFLCDCEDLDVSPLLSPVFRPRSIVSPKLASLRVDAMDIDLLLWWLDLRAQFGAPFARVYLLEPYARSFTPEQKMQLHELCEVIISAGEVKGIFG